MTRANSFLNEYRIAPNPMAGVAGRMKSMAAQAGVTGVGEGSAGKAVQQGTQSQLQVMEAQREQNRALTELNARMESDRTAQNAAIQQAEIDLQNHSSLLEDITYWTTAASAVGTMANAAMKATARKDQDGKVLRDDKGGMLKNPSPVQGALHEGFKLIRGITEVIPANKRARVTSEKREIETRKTLSAMENLGKSLSDESANRLRVMAEMANIYQGMLTSLGEIEGVVPEFDSMIKDRLGMLEGMLQRVGSYLGKPVKVVE